MVGQQVRQWRWSPCARMVQSPAFHATADEASSEEPHSDRLSDHDVGFQRVAPVDVRPAKVEPDQPWPLGVSFPPAMSLDYGDAAGGRVAIRAGSLRGNSHLELGQPRQDSYAVLVDESRIHIAVADGVGAQPHSHLGSQIAVSTAVKQSQRLAEPAEIATAVARALRNMAATSGLEPVQVSTTLCWARITIGAESAPWRVEAAEWGDSELLVYDPRVLRDGHPKWRRLKKTGGGIANAVLALPLHQVIQAQSDDSAWWHPSEVLGLYSDGISGDIRHDTVLGHALAEEWHAIPTPWEYVGQLAFRYAPANDDRTAITLWRRDGHKDAMSSATESPTSRMTTGPRTQSDQS